MQCNSQALAASADADANSPPPLAPSTALMLLLAEKSPAGHAVVDRETDVDGGAYVELGEKVGHEFIFAAMVGVTYDALSKLFGFQPQLCWIKMCMLRKAVGSDLGTVYCVFVADDSSNSHHMPLKQARSSCKIKRCIVIFALLKPCRTNSKISSSNTPCKWL